MRRVIRDGMARALHLTSWIEREESRGRTYPGQRVEDVAPETVPDLVREAADRLLEDFEKANGGIDATALFRLAVLADARRDAEAAGMPLDRSAAEASFGDVDLAAEFGRYVAMQAMGTGCAWTDDHAEVDMKAPHSEFGEAHVDPVYWGEAAEAALDRVRGRGTLRLRSEGGDFPHVGAGEDDERVLRAAGFPDRIVDRNGLEYETDGLESGLALR